MLEISILGGAFLEKKIKNDGKNLHFQRTSYMKFGQGSFY